MFFLKKNNNAIIEKTVRNELKKLIGKDKVDRALINMHFSYGDGSFVQGSYIYEKDGLYCYTDVRDNGQIEEEIKSTDIDEIYYRIYVKLAFNEALDYAIAHRQQDKDMRRVIFTKQLELLKCINEQYHIRRAEEIRQILIVSPYMDEM